VGSRLFRLARQCTKPAATCEYLSGIFFDVLKAIVAIFAVLLTFASCSRQKTVDREKLRSELLTSISFSSEAELFLERVMQGRVAAKFADGHVEYLSREIEREAKELQEGIPSHDIERQFNECKRQTESLAHEVASSKSMLMDKAALAEVEKRIVKIRETLQSTKSSL